jgi:hypothetical protein
MLKRGCKPFLFSFLKLVLAIFVRPAHTTHNRRTSAEQFKKSIAHLLSIWKFFKVQPTLERPLTRMSIFSFLDLDVDSASTSSVSAASWYALLGALTARDPSLPGLDSRTCRAHA